MRRDGINLPISLLDVVGASRLVYAEEGFISPNQLAYAAAPSLLGATGVEGVEYRKDPDPRPHPVRPWSLISRGSIEQKVGINRG